LLDETRPIVTRCTTLYMLLRRKICPTITEHMDEEIAVLWSDLRIMAGDVARHRQRLSSFFWERTENRNLLFGQTGQKRIEHWR
jgi:hypothetical protein